MNNSLNEYLRFNFELNIELNHFLARFNVKINNQNVSPTPRPDPLSKQSTAEIHKIVIKDIMHPICIIYTMM